MSIKFSIIVNCYNGEKFLKQALKSILNQSYTNWEVIFWDNMSTDKSREIFLNFKDKRLKYYYSKKHTNLYEARNLAIQKAKGDIITFLDVDDLWLKNKLKSQVNLFKDNKTNLVYGNYSIQNKFGLIIKKKFKNYKLPSGYITNALLKDYCIGLLTVAIRKKSILKYKTIFNSNLNLISDYDFIIRFSLKNKIQSIQKPVAVYRSHPLQQQKKYFYDQADHFCKWFKIMKKDKKFSNLSNFNKLKEKYFFYQCIKDIKKKNFWFNFLQFIKIKELKLSCKLVLILLFKQFAIKYILNMY